MTYVERLAGVAYFTLIIYCVASTGQYIAAKMGYGLDDSDPPFGRSGLSIYTDHLTGCQYLVSPSGGITPRLDAKGMTRAEYEDGTTNRGGHVVETGR